MSEIDFCQTQALPSGLAPTVNAPIEFPSILACIRAGISAAETASLRRGDFATHERDGAVVPRSTPAIDTGRQEAVR